MEKKKITDWCKDYFLKRCLCVGCYLKIRSINYRGHDVWLCPPLCKRMDIFSHVVLEITPSHLSESWRDPKKCQKASRVLLALYRFRIFWGKGNTFLITFISSWSCLKGCPSFLKSTSFIIDSWIWLQLIPGKHRVRCTSVCTASND